jgi:hypothetical protein
MAQRRKSWIQEGCLDIVLESRRAGCRIDISIVRVISLEQQEAIGIGARVRNQVGKVMLIIRRTQTPIALTPDEKRSDP